MARSTPPLPAQVAPPLMQQPAAAAPLPAPAALPDHVAMMPAQHRKLSLLEAIAAASGGFGDLTKDSKNDYLKSSYLALPGLLRAIKPALLEQGIVIYSQCVYSSGAWFVRTTLSFVDGSEEVSSDFPVPDATNLQRIGAAFTYGVRYNLFALLAVSPEADDDGNGAGAGSFAAPVQASGLPGLPAAASWPAPGQQAVAPQAMYPQTPPIPGYSPGPYLQMQHSGPQIPPQTPQVAVAYPVQPLPVLQ